MPDPPRRFGRSRRLGTQIEPHDGRGRAADGRRLIVASNRLPIRLVRDEEGAWRAGPAAGGLVTALSPVMEERGGVWVGWPGAPGVAEEELGRALERGKVSSAYEVAPVSMSAYERDAFYYGFSNEVLWPLLHGFADRCRLRPGQRRAYEELNRRFARRVARLAAPGDLIWVHDYHLMLVGRELRALGLENRIAFFLHTPFPRPEVLGSIAGAEAITKALLDFDIVGFQTVRDRDHFLAGIDRVPNASEGRASGTTVGAFPISIDFDEFAGGAATPEVAYAARQVREEFGGALLVLGVDRLDYTKGIPERLRGLDLALERHPELRGRVVLRQLVVPSRESVEAYAQTKVTIEELVERVNRRWGRDGWLPVDYRYESWSRRELLAHYRAADVALVTPLNDGMNLVAKEYCAANGGTGALILSAFAGAAAELGAGALLVDPSDPGAIASAIRRAHAMPTSERTDRMRSLKDAVRRGHVHRWVEAFLDAVVRRTGRDGAETPSDGRQPVLIGTVA